MRARRRLRDRAVSVSAAAGARARARVVRFLHLNISPIFYFDEWPFNFLSFVHACLPYLHSIDPLGTHRRYRRSAFVAQYFFYKSFLLCTLQIAHAFASAFAGASLFDSFALMTFNTFYTSLQPVAYALDRDVPDDDDGDGGGGGGTASGLSSGLGSGMHTITRINHYAPTNRQRL